MADVAFVTAPTNDSAAAASTANTVRVIDPANDNTAVSTNVVRRPTFPAKLRPPVRVDVYTFPPVGGTDRP